jgi:hypothetical protein
MVAGETKPAKTNGNLGFTELSASKHRTLSGKGIRFLAKCRQCLSTYIYLVCII